ncbi:MAG: hypothetical protein LLG09_02920 [Negativicutes bacterium]|nr:hypothetical protein [Negativicutes bacterium]
MKRQVPLLITLLVGVIVFLSGVMTLKIGFFDLKTVSSTMTGWGTLVSAFAAFIAAMSLVLVHVKRIQAVKKNPMAVINSLALLISMGLMAVLGIAGQLTQGRPLPLFVLIFNNVINPAGAAIFAMLGFFITSASYRAFRARSLEATILLVSALLIMLGRIPVGEQLWSQFPALADWLSNVPNAAAQRGILIGAAVGAIATSVRTILGFERGHLN